MPSVPCPRSSASGWNRRTAAPVPGSPRSAPRPRSPRGGRRLPSRRSAELPMRDVALPLRARCRPAVAESSRGDGRTKALEPTEMFSPTVSSRCVCDRAKPDEPAGDLGEILDAALSSFTALLSRTPSSRLVTLATSPAMRLACCGQLRRCRGAWRPATPRRRARAPVEGGTEFGIVAAARRVRDVRAPLAEEARRGGHDRGSGGSSARALELHGH